MLTDDMGFQYFITFGILLYLVHLLLFIIYKYKTFKHRMKLLTQIPLMTYTFHDKYLS